MRHSYDTDAIFKAMVEASDEYPGIRGMISAPFEAFLNSLPDQPGDDALREQAGLYKDLLEHPFFKDWSISGTSIRSFMMNKLDNAMTSHDDWQECEFEDIREGDRVRLEQAGWTTDFHLPVIETHPTHLVLRDNTQCSNFHKALYYRIPAPAQHPDPEVCKHIIVYKTTRQKYGEQNREYPSFHYSWDDDLWRGDISTVLHSLEILEWDYAKVVIDNDR